MDSQNKNTVNHWIGKITAYEREFKQWESRADQIVKKYRADKQPTTAHTAKFNILWANVQTLVPAVFARLPKPDVSRRFADNDPIARVASLILERALDYEITQYNDYKAAMGCCVQDRFIVGRGVAWVRYEPHTKEIETGMPEDGVQVTEDVEPEEDTEVLEQLDYECSPVDYVHWKDFGHTYARTWEEVTALWRRVYMDKSSLVERFGEELAAKIPLDTRPEKDSTYSGGDASDVYQAAIYEIWDKTQKKAIWVSKSYPEILDERDDPLQLDSFWPCPLPLYATLTTSTLVPVPDFIQYQDQALTLDLLAERIDKLVQALRVKGVHDAAIPELQRLFTEGGNGDLIPVANWSAFAEKNGLKGAIDLVDLAPIVNALNAAYEAMAQLKNEVFEIMGIADIVRGASDPNETYGAQQIKADFGSLRLKHMRREVETFATELLQLKAHIICTQYQPQTILAYAAAEQMSPDDQALIPQAIELLKNNPLRNFRVEVSSDSMVQIDESKDKADRLEFMKVAGGFLQSLMQVAQSPAANVIMPLTVSMMKFGVTAFKVGKGIEGEFDRTLDQVKQMASQPHPPPLPPQVQVEQMRQQGDMQKLQMEAQLESQKFDKEAQLEAQKFQAEQMHSQMTESRLNMAEQTKLSLEAQLEQLRMEKDMQAEQFKQEMQARENAYRNELESQRSMLESHQNVMLEKMQMQHEAMLQTSDQRFELMLARMNNEAKIEIAEASKPTVLQQDQIDAARNATGDTGE